MYYSCHVVYVAPCTLQMNTINWHILMYYTCKHVLFTCYAIFAGRRIGCRVRSALVGAIFKKSLKTDMSSSSFSSGELTNLMSVDATSVLEYACYAHFIWTSALSIAISVGMSSIHTTDK
jgi:hypothetical protein